MQKHYKALQCKGISGGDSLPYSGTSIVLKEWRHQIKEPNKVVYLVEFPEDDSDEDITPEAQLNSQEENSGFVYGARYESKKEGCGGRKLVL